MIKFIFESLKILSYIAAFQALLIAAFLIFQKKGNKINRILLAILLIDFIFFLSGSYILYYKYMWKFVKYAHLINLTIFLAPPILYLYFQSLITNDFRLKIRHIYHALPFAVIFTYMFYIIAFKYSRGFGFNSYGITLISLIFMQNIVYLGLILKQKNGVIFHNLKNNKTKWFGYIFAGIFIVFCFKLVIFITWNMFGMRDICIFLTGVFFLLSFIIINMLVLFGLSNPETLTQAFKYQNSAIDESNKLRYFEEIRMLLNDHKIYLDPLLSLDRMAKKLTISEKQLSQIINECTGKNFNDFINQYRIEEATNLIRKDSFKNILSVAYEVGFNSKSTFNTAFKKFTNMTPTEYRSFGA